MIKRYLAEIGTPEVLAWIAAAAEVACCRIGFVEVYRAIARAEAIDNVGAWLRWNDTGR